MISFLKTWSNQIIIAIILATILEMLLPNGKNKKYIKMVIGIYVLFTIVQPIFSRITGKSWAIDDLDYQKYFKDSQSNLSSQDFENKNTILIEQTYIESIKKDIKQKLEKKGYFVTNCSIQINQTENENYGAIEQLHLFIQKKEKDMSGNKAENSIQIKKIDIQVGNQEIKEKEKQNTLSEKEIKEMIAYLSNEYTIDENKIKIN